MDRMDKPRKSSAGASMAALAAAAAAGAGAGMGIAGADRTMLPTSGEEDNKTKLVNVPVVAAGASSSSAAAARRGGAAGGAVATGGTGGSGPSCQVERCGTDLTEAKRYHRRHKVCEAHSKAAVVLVAGLRQRFCQQCSRFHELSEFDDIKRSCRLRLAGHNERRRKSSADANGGGGGSGGSGSGGSDGCRHADQDGRSHPGNPPPNHFQIR